MQPFQLNLPHAVYTASQVRRLDQLAIQALGIPEHVLMQRAGEAAFRLAQLRYTGARRVLVLAGEGNNGGDGYVFARLAKQAGLEPIVITTTPQTPQTLASQQARESYLHAQGVVQVFENTLPATDLIVDAIFGTGLSRPPVGQYARLIDRANQHSAPIIALDIPSGLHADCGVPLEKSICADTTLTFVGLKLGLLTGVAANYCGDLYFDSLRIPKSTYTNVTPIGHTCSEDHRQTLLSARPRSAHKGDFGHALIIGGGFGMPNAAGLAASAAARCGAGKVSVICDPLNFSVIASQCPSLMVHPIDSLDESTRNSTRALDQLVDHANIIAIGPGLGTNPWARDLFARALDSKKSLVIDADALRLLAKEPARQNNWVLTPHPGEAAALLDCNSAEIQANRLAAIRELHKRYGGVIVLKGAGTLIFSDCGLSICPIATPALATGGSGDVLTGVITALIAQRISAHDAAQLGVYIHALAAQRASLSGERGVLAGDLIPHFRRLLNP